MHKHSDSGCSTCFENVAQLITSIQDLHEASNDAVDLMKEAAETDIQHRVAETMAMIIQLQQKTINALVEAFLKDKSDV